MHTITVTHIITPTQQNTKASTNACKKANIHVLNTGMNTH